MRIIRALSLALVVLSLAIGTYAGTSADSADAHMTSVTPITKVFADGLKVTAVAVKYDKAIKSASLSASDYIVKTDVDGQKITNVYTSTDDDYFTKTGPSGQYVVLELSTDYVIPVKVRVDNGPPGPRPPGAGPSNQGARPAETVAEDLTLNAEVLTKVGNISWAPAAHPASLLASGRGGNGKAVSVTQVGNITTTDGMTITAGTSAKVNRYVRNLTVDGFMKPDYIDPANGNVKYNIHFPRNYDQNKTYPLVVFLTDQNDSGSTHADALILANGGVIWADKDEEARHEAIVVVPLAMHTLVNEKYEAALETRFGPPPGQGSANGPAPGQGAPGGASAEQGVRSRAPSNPYLADLGLMDYLIAKIPNIDKSRIYLTGQGDGGRAAIKMMIDRPDLFAAALLFAPDYDPTQMAKLSKAKLWIVASEGDDATYKNMESCMDHLKASGASVSKAVWSGQSSATQFGSDVKSMIAEHNNIKFAVLKKGTVLPSGVQDDSLNNHAYTWRVGYGVSGLRDWLFAQGK